MRFRVVLDDRAPPLSRISMVIGEKPALFSAAALFKRSRTIESIYGIKIVMLLIVREGFCEEKMRQEFLAP